MDRAQPTWDGEAWTCLVELSHWRDLIEDSTGRVTVVFLADDDPPVEPSAEQLAELQRFCNSDDQLRKSVERALRRHYGDMRDRYLDSLADPEREMPYPLNASDFARIHTLQCVFVHAPDSGQTPCLGFSFHALWEIEHGLGAIVRGPRVLHIGGGDTSFLAPPD